MWRTELLHPLTIHFPIALLSVGSVLYILGVMRRLDSLQKYSFLLVVIGTVSAWAANITGGFAEDIVGQNLCDPGIRLTHEDFGYYTAYIFTAFVLVHILSQTLAHKFSAFLLGLNVVLALGGTSTLIYVGHLGATLTYQQAAGVYYPGPECKGYE